MATSDTSVSYLIINKLSRAQYDAILEPSETELYLVPDEIDTVPTSGSQANITSGAVYTAVNNLQSQIVKSDWNESDSTSYAYILNKPTIPTLVKSDWNVTDNTSYAYILNKPDGGDILNIMQSYVDNYMTGTDTKYYGLYGHEESFGIELRQDNGTVSTMKKEAVSMFSGSSDDDYYSDITVSYKHGIQLTDNINDHLQFNDESLAFLSEVPTLVKSDWNETNTGSYAYILNKPTGADYVNAINNEINSNGLTLGDPETNSLELYDTHMGLYVIDGAEVSIALSTNGIELADSVNDHLQFNDESLAFLSEVPNNTNLVHRSGAESISGLKSFTPQVLSQTYCYIGVNESVITYSYATAPNASTWDWSWIGVRNPLVTKGSPIKTLQQELDARDNVQADWSVTATNQPAYIKNKPDLSQYITTESPLTLGNTTGVGNAVTNISVSGHQITMTKGSTFLTEHQTLKTINNETIVGSGNLVVSGLPQVSSTDNGKILMVVNGQWQLVSPSVLYSGQGIPNNANGNNGDLYMQTN